MDQDLEILKRFVHGGLLDLLTRPSQLGALLTRKAILRISGELGISVPMDDRSWMMRKLAEQAANLHKINELLNAISAHLELINIQYEEIISKYPDIAHLLDEPREKLITAINEIRELTEFRVEGHE